jgi:hypothetical protein
MKRHCARLAVFAVLAVFPPLLTFVSLPAMADPMTLPELITALGAVKPPVDVPEPGNARDNETQEPATGDTVVMRLDQTPPVNPNQPNFCLDSNASGGALVMLETVPAGGIGTVTPDNVTPAMVSDILAFPPDNACFLDLFSDPLPQTFQLVNPDGGNVGTPLTFAQMVSRAGGRQVVFIQEGFLLDPRNNAPLGRSRNIQADFGVPDVTIFITPRPRDCTPANPLCGQIYIVHSDNPVPEPQPLTLILAAVAAALASRRYSRRTAPE